MGLGNPGPRFHATRHNVGFAVADRLAARHALAFRHPWFRPYLIARDDRFSIIKPMTFMNRSGEVLPSLLARAGTDPDHLVVIADNMDLPVGQVRIKRRGRSTSHNGIASVMDALGNGEFTRVYVGIGSPAQGTSVVDHVLGVPPASELPAYETAFERATEAVEQLLMYPIETVMNATNKSQ